jgi:hypothetical protein
MLQPHTIISTSLGGRFGNSDEAMIETSGDNQRIKKRYRNMTVFVKGLVNSQDDETLTHLPYFGDEHNYLSVVLGLEPCKENRKNSNARRWAKFGA